jgi:hypothetical protein
LVLNERGGAALHDVAKPLDLLDLVCQRPSSCA